MKDLRVKAVIDFKGTRREQDEFFWSGWTAFLVSLSQEINYFFSGRLSGVLSVRDLVMLEGDVRGNLGMKRLKTLKVYVGDGNY